MRLNDQTMKDIDRAFKALDAIEQIREEIEQFVGVSIHDVDVIAIDDVLQIIDKYAEQEPCDDDYQTDMDEAWKQAKREPCDDAISRQAAILLASIATMSIDETVKAIKRLPSVRPQEQTGHWIIEVWNNKEHHTCSNCQHIVTYEPCYHYCPYCGAKMVEPREREDKECLK